MGQGCHVWWGVMLPGQSYHVWYAQHSTLQCWGWGDMSPGQSCHVWYAQHSTLQCWGVGRHVARSELPYLVCIAFHPPVPGGGEKCLPGQGCHLWHAQRTNLHRWQVEKYIAWGTLHTSVRCWMVERQFRAQSGLPCLPCCLI